ncbi:cation:proton antiporter [Flavobacterium beibuense]|uniref:Sodium/hydrogen exchanger family protein n=1 Tax=Flavobacterium beibuense TaxID=657326 RepID=A0A444WAB3_9FLAO|nr:cation:proton antiporter [Flavobacterium beibuense]RYJ42820.1 Sodium/hydrogen exchanger family protein [Flavobacterium beibuense]
MQHHILINICAIFGVATAVIIICRFLKIRYIIGYLITGILLSPNTSAYFANMQEVEVYAEIGIILLLFTIGLEFSFTNLKKIQKYVLGGGSAQVLFTIALTAGLIWLAMRPSWQESVFWGFLYALSSTAIVIKTLQDSNKIATAHGKFILAVLLFQDVMIVPLMLFTPLLAGEGGDSLTALGWLLGKLVLMGGIAYLLTRYVIPYFLKTVMKIQSQEVFLIATVFIVTGIALMTEQLGLSLALGAFVAGLIIAETDYNHMAISCFLPFRYVFMSFFFISMGMLLNYQVFLTDLGWIIFWTLFAFFVKAMAGIIAVKVMGLEWKTAFAVGFSIAQIGEFSFVLAQSGLSHGLISDNNYQIFLAVSILLMSLTPFVVSNAERIYPIFNKLIKRHE